MTDDQIQFIRNDTNYQRCLDNYWDWKHNNNVSDKDNIDELYPLYIDQ